MMDTSDFYERMPPLERFTEAAKQINYWRLPEDWVVAVCDVVGSTRAIHEGRYKTVNMAGAAVISALKNALPGLDFPYVFGGDGATAALPANMAEDAAAALMATRVWVEEDLDLRLRAGIVGIDDIRRSGHDVAVARYRASPDASYAMFAGGGAAWAEAQLKDGKIDLPEAAPGSRPNLTGLSCRWSPIRSRSGIILSVVAEPVPASPQARFDAAVSAILELLSTSARNGHPVPLEGPRFRAPGVGTTLEVKARQALESGFTARRRIWYDTLLGYFFNVSGIKLGGFDMRRYRRVTARNSDFRKFEDGLRLTVDVEPETADHIEKILSTAEADGELCYGVARQDAALMTCIVPSYTADDHIHFIDGAGGGYAAAASRLKEKRAKPAKSTARA